MLNNQTEVDIVRELCRSLGIRLEGVYDDSRGWNRVFVFSDEFGVVQWKYSVSLIELKNARNPLDLIACVVRRSADCINDWLNQHAEGE